MTPKQISDIIMEHYVKPVHAEFERMANEASPQMLALVPALKLYRTKEADGSSTDQLLR